MGVRIMFYKKYYAVVKFHVEQKKESITTYISTEAGSEIMHQSTLQLILSGMVNNEYSVLFTEIDKLEHDKAVENLQYIDSILCSIAQQDSKVVSV